MAEYQNPTMRGLQSIQADKFPPSFDANLRQTNQSLEFLSKVVMVMQRGIDEADDTIFDDIKQLIDELIIFFSGGTFGEDAMFPEAIEAFGDSMVDFILSLPIIGNIAAFLGFGSAQGGNGGIDIIGAVGNFIDNVLFPQNKIPTKGAVDEVATAAERATQDALLATANSATARSESALALSAAQGVQAIADDALATADIAYENAQYWEKECVVSSAEVLLGVNELLIGMVMDVPTGKKRLCTDIHFALVSNPGTITVETKLQSLDGQTSRTVHTATMTAGQIRKSYNNLTIQAYDKERMYWNVILPYTTPANILQVSAVGVMVEL